MCLQKPASHFQENCQFPTPLKVSPEISKPVTLAVFENPALSGILDTSFHLVNLILTDKFHVKSWFSHQNVVILLYYLWVKKNKNSFNTCLYYFGSHDDQAVSQLYFFIGGFWSHYAAAGFIGSYLI